MHFGMNYRFWRELIIFLTHHVCVVDIMYFGMNYRFWRDIIIILTHYVCTGRRHNVLWGELQVLEGSDTHHVGTGCGHHHVLGVELHVLDGAGVVAGQDGDLRPCLCAPAVHFSIC